MKDVFLFVLIILTFQNLEANNPIDSPTIDSLISTTIGQEEYIFDDKNIKISVPDFADNPKQVPIYVDASGIKDAQKMILIADLNAITTILEMDTNFLLPIISTNIKVAQATPLRAFVKDSKNLWHIGSANILSNGGGCDISAIIKEGGDFGPKLGKTKGSLKYEDGKTYINSSIFHPMETGLFFGNHPYFVKNIEISSNGKIITTVKTTAAISQNPRITFVTKGKIDNIELSFEDSDVDTYELLLSKP